jgi:hypothetical protein
MWGSGPPGSRSLESETVKYDHESYWTLTREYCIGDDQQQLQMIDPSSRQIGYTI